MSTRLMPKASEECVMRGYAEFFGGHAGQGQRAPRCFAVWCEGALDQPMCLPDDYESHAPENGHRRLAGGGRPFNLELRLGVSWEPARSDG